MRQNSHSEFESLIIHFLALNVNSGSSTETVLAEDSVIKGAPTTAGTDIGFYASSSLIATDDLPLFSPRFEPV